MITGKLCQVPLFRLNSVLKQPGRRDEEDEEPESEMETEKDEGRGEKDVERINDKPQISQHRSAL